MNITVREFDRADMQNILPLIEQLNPKLSPDELAGRLSEMVQIGYRCVGAFDGDVCIGLAGFWFGVRFYCGKYIDVDNVIVDERYRSQGVGKLLMDWLEAYGTSVGCRVIVLDSYVTFERAHRFYFREGYRILGFHFSKELES